jgi:hypothetical protein
VTQGKAGDNQELFQEPCRVVVPPVLTTESGVIRLISVGLHLVEDKEDGSSGLWFEFVFTRPVFDVIGNI